MDNSSLTDKPDPTKDMLTPVRGSQRYVQPYPYLPWNWIYPYSMWGGVNHPGGVVYNRRSGAESRPQDLSKDSALAAGFLGVAAGVAGTAGSLPPWWGGAASTPANPTSSSRVRKFTIDEILGRRDKAADLSLTRDTEDEDASSSSSSSPGPLSPDHSTDSYSWLQCTRYKPPKLPRVKRKDGAKKRKLGRNPRIPFTQHQVNSMEDKFRQTRYLSSVDVAELSEQLNLTETRVKIWFQNRRARERRERENRKDLLGPTSDPQWSLPSTSCYPRPVWEAPTSALDVPCTSSTLSAFSPVVRPPIRSPFQESRVAPDT